MYQIYATFEGSTYDFGTDPELGRATDRLDRLADHLFPNALFKINDGPIIKSEKTASDLDLDYHKPVAVLKASSHRARDRLYNAIRHNGPLHSVYCFGDGNHNGAYRVNAEQLAAAKGVKGVTRSRKPVSEWSICWS